MRTKHIDVKYHFIRMQQSKDVIKVQKVPTEENLADIFTKVLVGAHFVRMSSAIMFAPEAEN